MVSRQASSILPKPSATTAHWVKWCQKRLETYENTIVTDPLTNSVRRLAYEVLQGLEQGTIDHDVLNRTAKSLCDDILIERAHEFTAHHNAPKLDKALFADLLGSLQTKPFDVVKNELERTRSGIVFTAHPTFAMSGQLRAAFAELSSATNSQQHKVAVQKIAQLPHAPDDQISLADEHAATMIAIRRAKKALRVSLQLILNWAQQYFPDQWTQLVPVPTTISSWVGYDLDGRTDIHWGHSFYLRLQEKSWQLDEYANNLSTIELGALNPVRDDLVQTLRRAATHAARQADSFDTDLDDPALVVIAANLLTKEHVDRLTSLKELIEAISGLIEQTKGQQARLDLCVLRAEMKNVGLGVARIHLRINSAQIRSVLRADLGIDESRGFFDRQALAKAAQKAGSVDPRKINTASIFLEKMTARRQLMLCAQFIKHIDEDTSIRFLIAECEAPATIMGAIYLARLYGVDHRIDISPLFETPEAMERGGRFIGRLLQEPEFVKYIKLRQRIAIQIGFSDSGRFMGQISSNLAIERLQILLARALADHDIQDVEVLIFNTHGESMGRGAYPGSLQERFDYLITPWTRARFAHEKLALHTECSFQGGDGFLHFANDHLANSTVRALLSWSFTQPKIDQNDRFYSDINFSWDFYRSIKSWQENLFDNPDYHIAISAFAPNLLFTTGSRKSRRQSGASVTGPRSLRAIPHNAILQQLAAPANVFGGVGHTASVEFDQLVEQINTSGRMHEIIGMIRKSRRVTSLPVMRAYGALFDASFWISKAATETKPASITICEEIANRLATQKVPQALGRLANLFSADLARLDRVLMAVDGTETSLDRRQDRRAMHALHAIRQALIMQAFCLVAALPAFSKRNDVTRSSLFELAFALRFGELADYVDLIFPADNEDVSALEAIEESSDDLAGIMRGYPQIQSTIVIPLREIAQNLREIGVGISHYYGAYG